MNRHTQAKKLAWVLEHYILSVVSSEANIQELKFAIKDGNPYLEGEIKRAQRLADEGYTLYMLMPINPNDEDFQMVQQYTKNPFTLIDIIFYSEN